MDTNIQNIPCLDKIIYLYVKKIPKFFQACYLIRAYWDGSFWLEHIGMAPSENKFQDELQDVLRLTLRRGMYNTLSNIRFSATVVIG